MSVRNGIAYLEDNQRNTALYPLEDEDVEEVFFTYVKSCLRSGFRYPAPYPESAEGLAEYVRMVEEKGGVCFLLANNAGKKKIGVAVLTFDWVAQRCDLVDFLWSDDDRRRVEAGLELLARYVFDGLGLVKFSRGTCDRSEIDLLVASHWRREGVLRKHCRVGSEFLDYHLFALFEDPAAVSLVINHDPRAAG